MSWNNSGNKDPWNNKQQPPDLEEVLKRFQKQLRNMFGGKQSSGSKTPFNKTSPEFSANNTMVSISLAAVAALWFLSGVFIVNPAERRRLLILASIQKRLNLDRTGFQA